MQGDAKVKQAERKKEEFEVRIKKRQEEKADRKEKRKEARKEDAKMEAEQFMKEIGREQVEIEGQHSSSSGLDRSGGVKRPLEGGGEEDGEEDPEMEVEEVRGEKRRGGGIEELELGAGVNAVSLDTRVQREWSNWVGSQERILRWGDEGSGGGGIRRRETIRGSIGMGVG